MRLEPKDSNEGFRWLMIAVVGLFVLIVGYTFITKSPDQSANQEVFSSYDGSCFALEQEIKKSMDDPDSFERVETTHKNDGSNFRVVTKFRAKNAFGAKVLQKAEGLVDKSDGHVISWRISD